MKSASMSRMPALDGLRGICVLWVIASHVALFGDSTVSKLLFHGDLGVSFFFLISGFIVTYLFLLERRRNGRVDTLAFYRRRFRRLVPPLVVFVSVVAASSFFLEVPRADMRCIPAALTFTAGIFRCGWNFGHLWSLSVEQMFYLALPAIVLLPFRGVLMLAVISRCVAYIFRTKFAIDASWIHVFDLIGRFDPLVIGAYFGYCQATRPVRFVLSLPVGLSFIYLPLFLANANQAGVLVLPFGPVIQAIGMAGLLGNALTEEGSILFRVSRFPVLVGIGLISYSLYLWQQVFFGPGIFSLEDPARCFVLLGVATVSYYVTEKGRYAFLFPKASRKIYLSFRNLLFR